MQGLQKFKVSLNASAAIYFSSDAFSIARSINVSQRVTGVGCSSQDLCLSPQGPPSGF